MTEQDWENQVKGFNKYEAIKLLAKGGMGAAFRVTSKKDFSDRALKLALGLDSEQYLEEETSAAICEGRKVCWIWSRATSVTVCYK